nr:MAG TPA: hypothetical protein [Bacteriophage sp.]
MSGSVHVIERSDVLEVDNFKLYLVAFVVLMRRPLSSLCSFSSFSALLIFDLFVTHVGLDRGSNESKLTSCEVVVEEDNFQVVHVRVLLVRKMLAPIDGFLCKLLAFFGNFKPAIQHLLLDGFASHELTIQCVNLEVTESSSRSRIVAVAVEVSETLDAFCYVGKVLRDVPVRFAPTSGIRSFAFDQVIKEADVSCYIFCAETASEILQAREAYLLPLTCDSITNEAGLTTTTLTVAMFANWIRIEITSRNICFLVEGTNDVSTVLVLDRGNEFPIIELSSSFGFYKNESAISLIAFVISYLSDFTTDYLELELASELLALVCDCRNLLLKTIEILFVNCVLSHFVTSRFEPS